MSENNNKLEQRLEALGEGVNVRNDFTDSVMARVRQCPQPKAAGTNRFRRLIMNKPILKWLPPATAAAILIIMLMILPSSDSGVILANVLEKLNAAKIIKINAIQNKADGDGINAQFWLDVSRQVIIAQQNDDTAALIDINNKVVSLYKNNEKIQSLPMTDEYLKIYQFDGDMLGWMLRILGKEIPNLDVSIENWDKRFDDDKQVIFIHQLDTGSIKGELKLFVDKHSERLNSFEAVLKYAGKSEQKIYMEFEYPAVFPEFCEKQAEMEIVEEQLNELDKESEEQKDDNKQTKNQTGTLLAEVINKLNGTKIIKMVIDMELNAGVDGSQQIKAEYWMDIENQIIVADASNGMKAVINLQTRQQKAFENDKRLATVDLTDEMIEAMSFDGDMLGWVMKILAKSNPGIEQNIEAWQIQETQVDCTVYSLEVASQSQKGQVRLIVNNSSGILSGFEADYEMPMGASQAIKARFEYPDTMPKVALNDIELNQVAREVEQIDKTAEDAPLPPNTKFDRTIKGKIVDENGKPLWDASVQVSYKGQTEYLKTNSKGEFSVGEMPTGFAIQIRVLNVYGYGSQNYITVGPAGVDYDYWWNKYVSYGKSEEFDTEVYVSDRYCGHGCMDVDIVGKDEVMIKLQPLGFNFVGKPLPEFNFSQWWINGPVKLEDYRGKVVLLELGMNADGNATGFNQWLGQTISMYNQYHDDGLEVIATHSNSRKYGMSETEAAEWKSILENINIPFPVAYESKDSYEGLMDQRGGDMNCWYLIDRSGNYRGPATRNNVHKKIKELLAEEVKAPEVAGEKFSLFGDFFEDIIKAMKKITCYKFVTKKYVPDKEELVDEVIGWTDFEKKESYSIWSGMYIHHLNDNDHTKEIYVPETNTLKIEFIEYDHLDGAENSKTMLDEFIKKQGDEGIDISRRDDKVDGKDVDVIELVETLNDLGIEGKRMTKMLMNGQYVKFDKRLLIVDKETNRVISTERYLYNHDNELLRKSVTEIIYDSEFPKDMHELGMPKDVTVVNNVSLVDIQEVRKKVMQHSAGFIDNYVAVITESSVEDDGSEQIIEAMVVNSHDKYLRVDVYLGTYGRLDTITPKYDDRLESSLDILKKFCPDRSKLQIRSIRFYDGLWQNNFDAKDDVLVAKEKQRRPDGDEYGDDDIADFGWKLLWNYPDREHEYSDEFSESNNLIGMEMTSESKFKRYLPKRQLLYVDPEKDYLMRRYISQELMDADWTKDDKWKDEIDKDWAEEEVMTTDVVEYGQTRSGKWYPKVMMIKGWEKPCCEDSMKVGRNRIVRIHLIEENQQFDEELFKPWVLE